MAPLAATNQLYADVGRHVAAVRWHESRVEFAHLVAAGQGLHEVRGHVATIRRVHELPQAQAAERGLVQAHERAERAVRAPHGAVHANHGASSEIVQLDCHVLTGSNATRDWHIA